MAMRLLVSWTWTLEVEPNESFFSGLVISTFVRWLGFFLRVCMYVVDETRVNVLQLASTKPHLHTPALGSTTGSFVVRQQLLTPHRCARTTRVFGSSLRDLRLKVKSLVKVGRLDMRKCLTHSCLDPAEALVHRFFFLSL